MRYEKPPPLAVRDRAWRRAAQRLNEALERNAGFDHTELIRRLREAALADVKAFPMPKLTEKPHS